jgi:hypothetical protein
MGREGRAFSFRRKAEIPDDGRSEAHEQEPILPSAVRSVRVKEICSKELSRAGADEHLSTYGNLGFLLQP